MEQEEILKNQFFKDKNFLPFFHAFKILKDDYKDENISQITQNVCQKIKETDFNNLNCDILNKQLDAFAHIIASFPLKDCLEIIKSLYLKDVDLIQKVFNRSKDGTILNMNFKKNLEQKASLINLSFFFDKAFNPQRMYRISKTISNVYQKKLDEINRLK